MSGIIDEAEYIKVILTPDKNGNLDAWHSMQVLPTLDFYLKGRGMDIHKCDVVEHVLLKMAGLTEEKYENFKDYKNYADQLNLYRYIIKVVSNEKTNFSEEEVEKFLSHFKKVDSSLILRKEERDTWFPPNVEGKPWRVWYGKFTIFEFSFDATIFLNKIIPRIKGYIETEITVNPDFVKKYISV
jgi:hypothetical protein